jgi:hypothetical protein
MNYIMLEMFNGHHASMIMTFILWCDCDMNWYALKTTNILVMCVKHHFHLIALLVLHTNLVFWKMNTHLQSLGRILVFVFVLVWLLSLIPHDKTMSMYSYFMFLRFHFIYSTKLISFSERAFSLCWQYFYCYLCLFAHSGVQHILCCVFVLFFFVLCCKFPCIVHFYCPFSVF